MKPGRTIDVNQTGTFNEAAAQLDHMKELLPPSIWQHREFEQLRRRIFYWLRGRHRFTAEYMSVVFIKKLLSIHLREHLVVTTTMEEDLAKDMSDLLFARSGVSLSPEELQSLQAAIRRKMGTK
ncbi:MAG: hypothetical protein NXY57DRAFT_1006089 [Lentinula lateritia]|uniref:Uncharacterized protein n=1 Tax=Lentinula lateritia TaxID=40482 RepID=A0ABQ8V118_9AGAR|nr:MAG: hypothetical protein NXY57DRAFT_1006089 [Lentinula lateritia]KAJ4468940.1 hypothetical protein C8R41DRAFT_853959 [Lentinula lateritia]